MISCLIISKYGTPEIALKSFFNLDDVTAKEIVHEVIRHLNYEIIIM
jgi:hypothetical protein